MGICTIELLYVFVILMGSFIFGSIIAFGSATLRIIKVTFGPLSNLEIGLFQAMPACIAIFGAPMYNFLLKNTTRKKCSIILGSTGFLFWSLLLTMNKKYFWISIIIRGFLGTVLAGGSLVPSVYVSELAPPEHKGFYVSLHPIVIIMGHIVLNLLGATHQWKYPVYTCMAASAILGIGAFFIPDSPYDKKLKSIDENTKELEDTSISAPLNADDQENLDKTKIEKPSLNDKELSSQAQKKPSLFSREYLLSGISTFILFFFPQFSGIGAINQNIAPMMSEVGLTFDAGFQASIALSAQLLTAILSTGLVDRLGGRKLYMISTSGSAVSLLLYALNIKFEWSRWLPMISLFMYQLFFGIGMSNVPWVVVPLIYPPELVSSALSMGISLSWFSAAIVMFFFPYLQTWFGQFGLMIILMVLNFINFICGVIFIKDPRFENKSKVKSESDLNPDLKEKLISQAGDEVLPNEL